LQLGWNESKFILVNQDSPLRGTKRPKESGPAELPVTRATVRAQLRRAVSNAVLDATEQLVAKHGLHDASMIEIAKRTGIAVGTLYNYFADRNAIIRGLFESRHATLRPVLRAAMAAGSELPFEPRLRGFVRGVFEAFDSHRSFLKVAIENEHLRPADSNIADELLAGARELVAAGVREGIIPEAKAGLLPLVITGTFRAVAIERIRHNADLTADTDMMVELLLDGIRGPR
jgi:AcrR family transcriptional regulator